MDDVAQKLGISKRTLYEHFTSKDELLMRCMEKCTEDARIAHQKLSCDDKDVLQIFMEHIELTIMHIKKLSMAFLQDIARANKPSVSSKFYEQRELNKQHLGSLIKRGQEEGFIRTDINLTLMVNLFTEQSQTIKEIYSTGKYSMEEIFDNVFISYLRGMCTAEGAKRIDEIKRSQNK